MKLLIAGGYDTQNLGDYASFLGLYKLIRSEKPNTEFKVLSRHPKDAFAQQFDVQTLLNLDHASKAESIGRIFNGFNEGDDTQHLAEIHQAIANCDCLVIGNGRLFIDISLGFMKGPLSYFGLLVMLAKLMNKPVVLSSVTLVHPATDAGKEQFKFILANSDKILVREPFSSEVAKTYINDHNKIEVLPDVAFALDKKDSENTVLPITIPESSIGVNFRGVDFTTNAGRQKISSTAKKLSTFLESTNINLVFIHQGTYNVDTNITDDRHINREIYQQLSDEHQSRCTIFDTKLTLKQTLALYKQLDYLFTERRHGFILALTQGIQASLICNESNTRVVSESIPIPELYLDTQSEFAIPPDKTNEIAVILEHLKTETYTYTNIFSQLAAS